VSVETRVRLRVSPGAARTQFVGRHGDGWKVRVSAPPEGGRANDAVVRLLADTLALPASDVAIVSGRGGRDKIVTLTGIDAGEAERRLAAASADGKDEELSAIDTTEFKQLLETERGRLIDAVRFLEQENPGNMEDELGEIGSAGVDNHLGDMAAVTFDRELDEGLEEGVRQTLEQIDAALGRIEDGTYGICQVCGKPIGDARLRARPWATLCIDDQRRAR
jgi:RNA polymerase-binding protein DksA